MVTGCGCHDVIVFGHSADCRDSSTRQPASAAKVAEQHFDTYLERRLAEERMRETAHINALPNGCRCAYTQSRKTGLWRLISRHNCPHHS